MSVWKTYEHRIDAVGKNTRGASRIRELGYIDRRLPDNLSYTSVLLNDSAQNAAVINTDNLNEKFIISMPGEDIINGSYVFWMENHWLITERDANTTLYTKAKMLQCNYVLKWVDGDDIIHEQWCVVEDGTKYLTGELEDRNFTVTRGDSRIAVTIARNEHTAKLGRENRFLIDDPLSKHKIAYALTKPLKVGLWYNGDGVYKFVLQEVNTTDNDNQELGIADYYKHFPHEDENFETEPDEGDIGEESDDAHADDSTKERRRWL